MDVEACRLQSMGSQIVGHDSATSRLHRGKKKKKTCIKTQTHEDLNNTLLNNKEATGEIF